LFLSGSAKVGYWRTRGSKLRETCPRPGLDDGGLCGYHETMSQEANVKYKDSFFSHVFGNKKAIRQVYEAFSGEPLPADAVITLATIVKIFFMGLRNDLSFLINDRLIVLIEHQSTINLSMPLRLLRYVTILYNKLVDKKAYYRRAAVTIPAPVFIVLYNGTDPYPDYAELRLSDLFAKAPELLPWEKTFPALELKVQVYNINEGRNPEIMARSELLRGYSIVVGKIREYKKTMPLKDAIEAAIKYCMENDILTDVLKTQSMEVKDMLLTEWNQEEAMDVMRAEAIEEGLEKGIEIGEARGRNEAMEDAARKALADGFPVEAISGFTGLDIETILSL